MGKRKKKEKKKKKKIYIYIYMYIFRNCRMAARERRESFRRKKEKEFQEGKRGEMVANQERREEEGWPIVGENKERKEMGEEHPNRTRAPHTRPGFEPVKFRPTSTIFQAIFTHPSPENYFHNLPSSNSTQKQKEFDCSLVKKHM